MRLELIVLASSLVAMFLAVALWVLIRRGYQPHGPPGPIPPAPPRPTVRRERPSVVWIGSGEAFTLEGESDEFLFRPLRINMCDDSEVGFAWIVEQEVYDSKDGESSHWERISTISSLHATDVEKRACGVEPETSWPRPDSWKTPPCPVCGRAMVMIDSGRDYRPEEKHLAWMCSESHPEEHRQAWESDDSIVSTNVSGRRFLLEKRVDPVVGRRDSERMHLELVEGEQDDG